MSDSGSPLARKLALIMGSVAGIEKRGWNPHHKYNYVLSTDVYEVTRKLLAQHGVVLYQKAVPGSRQRLPLGDKNAIISLDWEFEFVDSETGESKVVHWASEGQDNQDKGTNKAATAARKYFLVTQFQIPIDQDDADAGPAPARNGAPAQAPATAKPATQNQAAAAYNQLAKLAQEFHQDPRPLQQVLDTLSRENVITDELGKVERLTDLPLPLVQKGIAVYQRLVSSR